MQVQQAVELFVEFMKYTLPVSVVFTLGGKLVNMFLTALYGGRIEF